MQQGAYYHLHISNKQQIWFLDAAFSKSRGFQYIKYDILTIQPVNFLLVNQTRSDQSGQTQVIRP